MNSELIILKKKKRIQPTSETLIKTLEENAKDAIKFLEKDQIQNEERTAHQFSYISRMG